MATDYRLALGTLSAAGLTTSYLLSAFPLQSDQISLFTNPWDLLSDDLTTFPKAARYVTLANNTQRADGHLEFNWGFAYLTEGMASYLESTFFGIYESALVTVRTRIHTGTYQTYNATMLRPVPNEHFRHGFMGLEQYVLRFLGARVAS